MDMSGRELPLGWKGLKTASQADPTLQWDLPPSLWSMVGLKHPEQLRYQNHHLSWLSLLTWHKTFDQHVWYAREG